VLQQRAKLEDEQQSAAKAEIVAQHNVEKAHALVAAAGAPSAGGYPGGAHNGSNGHAVLKTAATAGEAPHTPLANGNSKGNGAVTSPNTTTSSNSATTSPVAASTASPSTPASSLATSNVVLSPAEQKAAAAEKAFNQAKLDLAAAEDYFEQKRGAAEQMNASLRAESTRLEALERAHLMVRFRTYSRFSLNGYSFLPGIIVPSNVPRNAPRSSCWCGWRRPAATCAPGRNSSSSCRTRYVRFISTKRFDKRL
jgi:hypothetical protein